MLVQAAKRHSPWTTSHHHRRSVIPICAGSVSIRTTVPFRSCLVWLKGRGERPDSASLVCKSCASQEALE
jgi:hypothetical protein